MSRCFPFPPPGYEAERRSEDKDLLKKEKQKTKKHKKERKDGGKRERKEKSRGHRKDKHKNKHKREKHEDRTKKKGRDEERRQVLEQGTQKNGDLDNRRPKQIVNNEAVKDSKQTDELTSQIMVQEGHANSTGSSTGKLLPRNSQSFGVVGSKVKERTSISRENEKSGKIGQHNHASENGKDKTIVLNCRSLQGGPAEKYFTGIHGSNGVGLQRESSKGVLATTAAIQQKRKITPSTNAAQRIEQVDQQSVSSSHSAYGKSNIMTTMTEKNGGANNFHSRMDKELVGGKKGAVQGNAEIKEEKANHQKVVKDGDRGRDVNHKAIKDRYRDHNVMNRKAKKSKNGAVQSNVKIKEEKTNHQKSVKDGERDHNVNHKAVKDTDRDHNVKKRKAKDGNEGKVREKRSVGHEQKRKELDGHGIRKNYIHEMDSAHLNGNNFISDDVKKREDLNTNDSLHEHGMRMTKMPRTSPANHLRVNGKTLKHSQGTAPCSSTLSAGSTPCGADMLQDIKECCNDGITGSRYLEKHKSLVSSASYDSSEVYLTPPHPDTKYLSQLYSIPAADDCSEYIDQDWLFSGDLVHRKSTVAAEPLQVWAEAQPMDSADVVAMPYIVPL
ncbi:myb-like protein X [Lolium rigidum]|uniref:myb-like protein X n=1 Tax=Lolium rigidum TaxID=89674 RepID=UPI001F5C745F|nr:myb-like protein X [Lolium rigidum]